MFTLKVMKLTKNKKQKKKQQQQQQNQNPPKNKNKNKKTKQTKNDITWYIHSMILMMILGGSFLEFLCFFYKLE